jgi:hypothetical protein
MVRTTVVKTHSRQRELNPTPVEPPTVRHLPLVHAYSTYLLLISSQLVRANKIKLVHNLGDMDEVLDLELNEHIDISDEYLTIRNILRSFKVKGNPLIMLVEKNNTLGTYRFLYEKTMEKYMVDLMSNIDAHIKDTEDWEESDGHYIYNIIKQVTPYDAMRSTENSGFWKKYAATIDSGTTPPALGADVDLSKPLQRRPRTFVSYSAVVQKTVSTKATQQSQNMDATMDVSTISGAIEMGPVLEGIADLKRKLADIDTDLNRYSAQQQKVEDDVNNLTQSMHKMASHIIDI